MKIFTPALESISFALGLLVLVEAGAHPESKLSLLTSMGIAAAILALWISLIPIYLRWRNEG